MRVLIKDNTIPIHTIHEIVVLKPSEFKWIESLVDSVGPNDIDLSTYKIRRICVDVNLVTVYVLPKETTNGQD